MKYTAKMITERFNCGEEMEFIFFWGHTSTPGKIRKSCCSQWYPCEFEVDGQKYFTTEQFMMAQKALLFKDQETYEKIMAANDPKDFKALGRTVRGFDEYLWNEHKFEIVVKGNEAKFGQNPELLEYLLSTGDKILVEASPFDGIWGVKLPIEDSCIQNPNLWRGENLLGFAIMEARDILREYQRRCDDNERLHSLGISSVRKVSDNIRYEYFTDCESELNPTLILLGNDLKDDTLERLVDIYHHDGDAPELRGDFGNLVIPEMPYVKLKKWKVLTSVDIDLLKGYDYWEGYTSIEEDDSRLLKGFCNYYWMYESEVANEYLEVIRSRWKGQPRSEEDDFDSYTEDDFSDSFKKYFSDFFEKIRSAK